MSESRATYLKRTYGMTEDEYDTLSIVQGHRCALCRCVNKNRIGEERPLVVDHSHRSGSNRGLLCDACNKGLGCFRDSQELLLRALVYLREHDGPAMSYQSDVSVIDSLPGSENSQSERELSP